MSKGCVASQLLRKDMYCLGMGCRFQCGVDFYGSLGVASDRDFRTSASARAYRAYPSLYSPELLDLPRLWNDVVLRNQAIGQLTPIAPEVASRSRSHTQGERLDRRDCGQQKEVESQCFSQGCNPIPHEGPFELHKISGYEGGD
jgi:hypothetical protein